ncbi:MAG TPA: DEAD/DEAH box helicase [Kofleriaceae bacterium]
MDHQSLEAFGDRAFAKGRAYWQRGAVLSMGVDGDELVGVVEGGEKYDVRLRTKRPVRGSCSCPVGTNCKHAVALGLAYLEAAVVPAGGGFANTAELQRWAAEHGVRDALARSAEALLPYLLPVASSTEAHWYKQVLPRLAVREIGHRAGASHHAGPREMVTAMLDAARAFLDGEVALVREGRAEERLVAAHEPSDADGLRARLATLRQHLRDDGAQPRPAHTRSEGTWQYVAKSEAIRWTEPWRAAGPRPLVTTLAMPGGGAPILECTCGSYQARCTHGLALIDETLARLGTTEGLAAARGLLRPSWERALAAFDRIGESTAPARIELAWEIDEQFGGVTLTPIVRREKRTRGGGFTAGARISPTRLLEEHADQLDDVDRRAAEAVAAHGAYGGTPVRAFATLAGHPRVFRDGEPISIVRAPLGFSVLPSGDAIHLQPAVAGEPVSLVTLRALVGGRLSPEPLVVFEPDHARCLVLEIRPEAAAILRAIDEHGASFPPEAHAPLLERLARLEGRLPLDVPEALKGRELPLDLVVVVRARLVGASLELELFVRPAPTAPLFPPGIGPREVMVQTPAGRGYVRRTLDEEGPHARALFARLPVERAEEAPPGCFQVEGLDDALAVIAALADPPDGLEAAWVDAPPAVAPAPKLDQLRVSIERKRDWFGIQGELRTEAGRVELAVVLDAARRQQRYVRIGENQWAELSAELRDRVRAIAEQTYEVRGRTEISPGAVAAVRALAAAGAHLEAAPAWRSLADRVLASQSLRPKPPAALSEPLRDYQIEGHAWLRRVAEWGAGACLADDMGLGKTVQAIALLLDRAKLGPALVLAPTSVAFNWIAELKRFAPDLRPTLYSEATDRAALIGGAGKKDVIVASYGLLVRDAEILSARGFATLILDEAQAIKNAQTRRAKAARLLHADFRLAMSGTPFENHLGELWSVYATIFPGLFGSWDAFRDRFAIPIEKGKSADARASLSRVLRPVLLRRTKSEVARELPPRTEIVVPIALSTAERAMYEDARLAAVAELEPKRYGNKRDDAKRRFQVLAALTRLRLLASHPRLHDPASEVPSSKLARAVELLEELRAEGHRALVFSQFTSHLAIVREALVAAGFELLYLDGSTPAGARGKLISEFQAGKADAFLISLKAGGTGINLTAADYVLHLDPWWNPAVEDQATDRAHRIGQTRPVTVYRLVAHETIEEKILELHADKRALVSGVLDGTSSAESLSTTDLLALLGG